MNCLECQAWLQRRLDGEAVPEAAELEKHLAACPACRQQHLAAQVLLEGLRSLKRPLPAAEMSRRIVAGVLTERAARRRNLRRLAATTAALAAAILLMALGGYLWLPDSTKHADKTSEMVKQPIAKPPAAFHEDAAPSLRQSAEDARLAVTSLTERLADKSKEQARWLWSAAGPLDVSPMLSLPAVDELEQPLDPAAQSLRQAGAGVSEGLQTVAQSAGRAVAYFMREFPPMDPGAKN